MINNQLKKNIIIIFSGFLIILALLFYAFGFEESPEVSDELVLFESNFYEFLNQNLEEISIIQNSSDATTKIKELVQDGLQEIDNFQSKKNLSDYELTKLNKLRFYVYSSIALDEEQSRLTLEKIPSGGIKFALLHTYIETFADVDNREKISYQKFKEFINAQLPWVEKIDNQFSSKLDLILFNANPIGKNFPNHFKGKKGTRGENLDLSLYQGKYVLIDYWASWCLPCIAEIPYLIEAYNRFHNKGFEIISVTLDENESNFKSFIKDRNIQWIQYFDGKGFKGNLIKDYGVTSIPTLYLLDPQGKVIFKNLNGETLVKVLEKKLL